MKEIRYRVETFIVPVCNDRYSESSLIKTDDAKLTEMLITQHDSVSIHNDAVHRMSHLGEECVQNFRNSIILSEKNNVKKETKEEAQRKGCQSALDEVTNECQALAKVESKGYSSKSVKKIQPLLSIDEVSEESDEKFPDLCYHGCQNGCSAVVQSPQEVSEEVFKENCLQKLELIRGKETNLKSKEMVLQNRERALFKREREIRIMERLLKEKLKQVEQHLQGCKCSQIAVPTHTSEEQVPEPIHNNQSKESHEEGHVNTRHLSAENSKSNSTLHGAKKKSRSPDSVDKLDTCLDNNTVNQNENHQEKVSRPSTSSSGSSTCEEKRAKRSGSFRTSTISRSSHSTHKMISRGNKTKRPPRPSYEDLDTTLSADIGDASFVQTSERLNPEIHKMPFAFARSYSERRPRRMESRNYNNPEFENQPAICKEAWYSRGIEQERVLKRVTENISASQDKSTKFQNYGLIDQNVENKNECLTSEKKYSYLNLEVCGKLNAENTKKTNNCWKERPTSWNGGSNEWLQKKVQTHNPINERVVSNEFENKENKFSSRADKSEKVVKKKDIRNKIFTIFR